MAGGLQEEGVEEQAEPPELCPQRKFSRTKVLGQRLQGFYLSDGRRMETKEIGGVRSSSSRCPPGLQKNGSPRRSLPPAAVPFFLAAA